VPATRKEHAAIDGRDHRLIIAGMADDAPSNQQRILDAARALFLSKGYNGSNLRDIAREAKVSMGGIYHHFISKEEIYRSLLQDSTVAADMMSILPLLRAETFPDNLPEVGDALARVVRKHRDTFKLFYIDVLEFEGRNVKPVIERFWDGFRDLAGHLLRHRAEELIDVHPAVIMRIIMAVFVHTRLEEVMLDLPVAKSIGLSDEEITRQMARVLLEGVLRRPDSP